MQTTLDEPLTFCGGPNIAMKIPTGIFNDTLAFYRDVLRLPPASEELRSHVFRFGSSLLWLDPVEGLEVTEVWLEIATSDTAKAAAHLARRGVERCDGVEALPDGFDGFWIKTPASVIHLVTRE